MIGKNSNRETTDEEAIFVIRRFRKNAYITLENCTNFTNKAENCHKELDILESYLPKQLTQSEIKHLIVYSSINLKFVGAIMKFFKENYAGKYESQTVINTIKEMT
jgi:uncharacterized protein YqeY